MGLLNWFSRRRNPAMDAGLPALAVAIAPKEQEPLTPAEVADLKAAWAELAQAAKESPVTGFHACSRGRRPWQEDPAAVRAVAALLRSVDADDAAAEGPAAT